MKCSIATALSTRPPTLMVACGEEEMKAAPAAQ
jgi:hypothetical protein